LKNNTKLSRTGVVINREYFCHTLSGFP
jgi:hypothetical protein